MNNYNPFTLEGKTILVTGASSGIGRATAIECAKMGAKLIITARNEQRLQETLNLLDGDGHKMIIADLTAEEDMKRLIETLPLINGTVQCAGLLNNALVPFCSLKKFKNIFETNFFAQTELIRLLVKNKKLAEAASIVVISSVAIFEHTLGNSIYGASKSALSVWIKYAAKELGKKNFRLNSICPGMIETEMIRGGAISDEQLEEDKKSYPLGRYGQPSEIGYGAIYLLSDATKWVTGTNLVIDGGVTL